MKRPILATIIALGLAGVGGASAAQDGSQTTNLQHVTVTSAPGQYETYAVNLNTGYGLEAFVGHTHRQYMQAQRVAEDSEAMRKRGLALSPFVAVAIDNSSGPGLARRILLFDPIQDTVAVVDVYCKHVAPAGGKRCQLVPRPVSTNAYSQSQASRGTGRLALVEVGQR
jgi:hypothetical protein